MRTLLAALTAVAMTAGSPAEAKGPRQVALSAQARTALASAARQTGLIPTPKVVAYAEVMPTRPKTQMAGPGGSNEGPAGLTAGALELGGELLWDTRHPEDTGSIELPVNTSSNLVRGPYFGLRFITRPAVTYLVQCVNDVPGGEIAWQFGNNPTGQGKAALNQADFAFIIPSDATGGEMQVEMGFLQGGHKLLSCRIFGLAGVVAARKAG